MADNKKPTEKDEHLRAVDALNTFINVEGLPPFDRLRRLMAANNPEIRVSERFLETHRALLQPLLVSFANEFKVTRDEMALILCLMYQGCIMACLVEGRSPEQIMDLVSGWLLEKIAGTNVRN